MHHPIRKLVSVVARGALVALVAALSLQSAQAQGSELALGAAMPRPDLVLQGADGRSLALSGAAGQAGTVVVFWGNACPWATKLEGRVLTLARDYGGRGFGFVFVNSNDPNVFPEESAEKSRAHASGQGYGFPYLMDTEGRLASAFGATRTPQVFVFDRDGKLVYTGTVDDNPSDPGKVTQRFLQDALDASLAGRAVAMPRTKAFGCTIKARGGVAG